MLKNEEKIVNTLISNTLISIGKLIKEYLFSWIGKMEVIEVARKITSTLYGLNRLNKKNELRSQI